MHQLVALQIVALLIKINKFARRETTIPVSLRKRAKTGAMYVEELDVSLLKKRQPVRSQKTAKLFVVFELG